MKKFSEFAHEKTPVKEIPLCTEEVMGNLTTVLGLNGIQPREYIRDYFDGTAKSYEYQLLDSDKVIITFNESTLKFIVIEYVGDAYKGMRFFNVKTLATGLGVDEQTFYVNTRMTNPIEVRNRIRVSFIKSEEF